VTREQNHEPGAPPRLFRPEQAHENRAVDGGRHRRLYLLREHWDHVAGNWVYVLLLACPLMHVFHGHGGHGGHGSHDDHAGHTLPADKPVDKAS
jgi:hypothetical protein